MSCGVGHRHGLDPALLWLWGRLVAVAPIQPLAWEFPYATGVTLKNFKKIKMIQESDGLPHNGGSPLLLRSVSLGQVASHPAASVSPSRDGFAHLEDFCWLLILWFSCVMKSLMYKRVFLVAIVVFLHFLFLRLILPPGEQH